MSNRANLCKAAAVAVKKLLDIYHVNYPTVWVDSKTKLREIACILNADHWNTDFTERFDVEACVKELKERYGVIYIFPFFGIPCIPMGWVRDSIYMFN